MQKLVKKKYIPQVGAKSMFDPPCIRTVLLRILPCLCPVLLRTHPAYVLSCFGTALPLSCPASDLPCIRTVLYCNCPALQNVAKLKILQIQSD